MRRNEKKKKKKKEGRELVKLTCEVHRCRRRRRKTRGDRDEILGIVWGGKRKKKKKNSEGECV